MLNGNGGANSRCAGGRRRQMSAGSNTSDPSVAWWRETMKRPLRLRATFRQGSDQFQRHRAELSGAVVNGRSEQQIAFGLQLREILDPLADAALKCFLQRKTDAGNADDRASLMHGIGECWIELRAEGDEAGRIGRGEFEYPRNREAAMSKRARSAVCGSPVAGCHGK